MKLTFHKTWNGVVGGEGGGAGIMWLRTVTETRDGLKVLLHKESKSNQKLLVKIAHMIHDSSGV